MRDYKLDRDFKPRKPLPVAAEAAPRRSSPPPGYGDPAQIEKVKISVSVDLIRDLERRIRQQFYFDKTDKVFYQQRGTLIKALTYPAKYLAFFGMTCEVPADQYRAIIDNCITDVKRFGQMDQAYSPAHYFHKVVQTHMQHHGEEYYEAAKSTRNVIADVALGLKTRLKKMPETDSTLSDLSSLHDLAKHPKGRKRAPQPPANPQLDLFA